MRKDVKRYYKLENKEIRNNERIQKKYDRLYDEQSTSRPSEGFGISDSLPSRELGSITQLVTTGQT